MTAGLALLAGLAGVGACSDGNGTGVEAEYSLQLTSATLTIHQGANGNTTVNITRTAFTGGVTLSLSNAPAGVTASFNPAVATGDNSTLTLTVAATVVPGVYDLSVDGTGTPGNRSTALTLTVDAAPDYSLSLNPAALSIVQGGNGNTAVTLTRTNFTGAVTLSLGGAPAGVTGAFNPAAPTGIASTLTVSVGPAAAPGVYNLTVDGTGVPGNRSTSLTLTVTAAPADYALSLAPAAFSVAPGTNGNTTVNIARTNFTGAVTLSLGGAPTGITGSFNPAAPTGATSTLTVTVGAAVTPGVYNLTVDGTGAPGNHSTGLTLTVSAAPDYALSLNPTSLSIAQGGNAPTAVTITRTNFTGAVTLSLGGAPTGVTGAFNPAAPTGTTSTLTVTVGAAVTPGVYNLTVDGTGTAGNRSTPLTLTVSAAPNYTLSLNPTSLSIAQGGNAPTTVTITRTNFTGAVTLSLGGAPTGVTGAFNPSAPTGTTSTLTVTVGAAVTPGVYNLMVNGTGTPGNRSTPLTLTVTSGGGGGGNVTWNFASCPTSLRPVWLAVQDGNGAWAVVTPVSNAYSFTITTRGGIAYVLTTASTSSVIVQFFAKTELAANTDFCPSPGVLKTVNGTVAGVGATEAAHVSLGGGSAFVYSFNVGFPNFQITSVLDGAQDLLASHRPSLTGAADKAIIRRGLNIPNNGSIGSTLDFTQPEAFTLDNATMTITGLVGGEQLSQSMAYNVAGCIGAPLYSGVPAAGSSITAAGVPAAQQAAGDYHGFSLFAHDAGTNMTRTTTQFFHAFGAKTIALAALFPIPTVTSLAGPYKRLQAVYTLPTDYEQSTSLVYTDHAAAGKSVTMQASFAYLGGTAVTMGLADYSGLAGWDNNWAPASVNTADWSVAGTGGNATSGFCTEGARVDRGQVSGSN